MEFSKEGTMDTRFAEIPYEKLSSEILKNLIEEFISRDGTHYSGKSEVDLDEKVNLVIKQLESGDAIIVWDLNLETGTITLKKDFK